MSPLGPWLESAAVVAVAVLAFLFGRWCSRLPKPYWLLGYFIPLALLLFYWLAMLQPRLRVTPPLSWVMLGRPRFVYFNFLATVLLSVPWARLPEKRSRAVVGAFIVILAAMSVVPFLAPIFSQNYLAGLKTRIDADGVCLQSNDYTCAPAAAVTALRKLGFPAEEGELAILSYTSSLTGTEPDVLARALQRRYGPDGLVADYRAFRDVGELKTTGLTVALVKYSPLIDHCVAVLRVENTRVVVGDPLNGLASIPAEEFRKQWRFVGVVLKRVPSQSVRE
jgi:hypothetical protein